MPASSRPPVRFSRSASDGMADGMPFRYPDFFEIQSIGEAERLAIAPAQGHVAIMLEALEWMQEPLGVLYFLLLSRRDNRPIGRYASDRPHSRSEVVRFLETYSDFFEGDGRHHLWVGGPTHRQLIVYDQHNLVYAYGDRAKWLVLLGRRGIREGKIELPVPHSHHFNAEFDEDEAAVLSYWGWRFSPAQPTQDRT